jgi:uncharacterized protein (TIGR02271 family)
MDRNVTIAEGTNVYGSDGDKVGSVVSVQPSYIVVEKGIFFPTDYYIPVGAIASAGDDGIYLNVTKDAALNQGWDTEPVADYAATTEYTRGDAIDDTAVGAVIGATGVGAVSGTTGALDEETIRVPIYEEELTATTRERELGQVRVTKDVVAEERTLEVPVTEERVRVTRRTVDRPATAADTFQEGVIEVPIRGQEVDVQKQVRVAEEVEIAKEQVQRTERVSDRVRREEVRIDDETATVETDLR